MSIALRQSQMDIFDFISLFSWQKPSELVHEMDSTAGRGSGWCYFPVAVPPFPLALYDPRSVLAVKGPLRRFAPWTAPGRSEGLG